MRKEGKSCGSMKGCLWESQTSLMEFYIEKIPNENGRCFSICRSHAMVIIRVNPSSYLPNITHKPTRCREFDFRYTSLVKYFSSLHDSLTITWGFILLIFTNNNLSLLWHVTTVTLEQVNTLFQVCLVLSSNSVTWLGSLRLYVRSK